MFSLTLDPAYDQSKVVVKTSRGETLTPRASDGKYVVRSVNQNIKVTIEGVELNPTEIESISEGSQLYTVKGAVVVSPAEPLRVAIYSVTGQTLFNDEVSYLTQVPAKAGIYVVVIQKGKERITEKVFVK